MSVRRWSHWLLLALVVGLAGCSATTGVGYYWQSVTGHVAVMRAARPVDEWLSAADTPAGLRQRLEQAQRMRRFAVEQLALPDNASYTRYADLQRRAVVWNVVAAPPYQLTLHQWCFPVVGCVGYRGYFSEADARAFAASQSGPFEVAVYPVPAYSTLGWTNWLGGDPLLSTFIGYPEGELARILFHELAHQVVYVSGDMVFNESFATAVERLGGERWMATEASPAVRLDYERFDARRREFRALTRTTRDRLAEAFAQADEAGREVAKQRVMADFRTGYQALKANWGGFSGYDPWALQANNALFAAQRAYDELVPGFVALFEREGRDFPRFYDAVRALARLPQNERHAALEVSRPAN